MAQNGQPFNFLSTEFGPPMSSPPSGGSYEHILLHHLSSPGGIWGPSRTPIILPDFRLDHTNGYKTECKQLSYLKFDMWPSI